MLTTNCSRQNPGSTPHNNNDDDYEDGVYDAGEDDYDWYDDYYCDQYDEDSE